MSETDERREVVVVGGGVIGCAAARWLAADHDVLLLERGHVAGDTSGKASGMVTNVASFRAHPRFAAAATEFFPRFDGTGDFAYTERESVELVPTGTADAAKTKAATAREDGFDAEYLPAAALEDAYPETFRLDDYAGGVVFDDTGWLDPYTYTTTLKDAASDRGADVRTGVTVTGLTTDGDAVTGVETTAGSVRADDVVVAAGWRSRDLCLPHLELPVYPFRWQAATLDPGWDLPESFPMGWDPVMGRYWRPEHNGTLHVGGDEYVVEEPGTRRESVTEAFTLDVATDVPERLRGFDDARFVRGDTCPTGDATTPDTYPIVDSPADGPDGLTVATGFHIGGIMSSPAVGEAVRALVAGDEARFPLDPFRLDRFETRGTDFPFVPHMTETAVTDARAE